jgi:hypothetical protein
MTDKLNWLTDPHRDFLAYLTVLTIQPQLKPERSFERVAEALEGLAADGEVKLLGDQQDVYVIIHGEVIVHAARDWLDWAVEREATRKQN